MFIRFLQNLPRRFNLLIIGKHLLLLHLQRRYVVVALLLLLSIVLLRVIADLICCVSSSGFSKLFLHFQHSILFHLLILQFYLHYLSNDLFKKFQRKILIMKLHLQMLLESDHYSFKEEVIHTKSDIKNSSTLYKLDKAHDL